MTQTDRTLTPREAQTLAAVLDELLPPAAAGTLPGAGALGVGAFVDAALAAADDLRPMIRQGLAELEDVARQRHELGFGELSQAQKVALLNEQGFIFPLMLLAYAGYYQDPRVLDALGLPTHPPHPKGYELETDDLSLLDPVRNRGRKLYREA